MMLFLSIRFKFDTKFIIFFFPQFQQVRIGEIIKPKILQEEEEVEEP